MLCPLCAAENDDRALVCQSCGRDIAVPPALMVELDMLRAKREALVHALEDVHARLNKPKRSG